MPGKIVIWHNSSCGSSKGALDYLKAKGLEPEIYLYMKEKPGEKELKAAVAKLKLKPSELLRPGEKKGEELGLYAPGVSQEAILAAMAAHPALIQRAIVFTDKGAVIARPKTRIDEIV